MRRTLHEKSKDFFLRMGKRNKILRIPAIAGLAASMLLHGIISYFTRGTKRFACTIFILLCFMVGNSFAYPVFLDDGGFVSEDTSEEAIIDSYESEVTLAQEASVEYDSIEMISDDDVLEGYSDAELHGMEEADKYSLDEILESNEINPDVNETSTKADIEGFRADDWKLVLINKQHPIPEDYTFVLGDIKTIKGNMKCDERIIEELLSMMQSAKGEDVTLAICSPYRDLNRQEILFNRKIEAYMSKGMSYMEAYKVSSQAVTVPGASEHQIGLAIDIVSDTYVTLDEGFGDTQAGKWLEKNCWKFGFVLRYPKGKEYITSIEFEPWHFRYVGKEAAEVIMKEEITLEEFWDKYL